MPGSTRKSSIAWAVAFSSLVLLVVFFIIQGKRGHEMAELTTQVHLLSACLHTYVDNEESFPESLPAMVQKEGWDPRVLVLSPGATLVYTRPRTNAPAETEVIVVTYRGSRIVVTKGCNLVVNY